MGSSVRSRNWLRTTFLVAVLVALGACTRGCFGARAFRFVDGKETRWSLASFAVPVAKTKLTDRFVSLGAKKGSTGAFGFTRVPYDLWAPFDLSIEFGIYREDLAAGIGPGLFGIELDARNPGTSATTEFYGCFAQFVQDGLNVFVSKRGASDSGASNVGAQFFPGARRVEVFVAHDGANLVFRARPANTTQTPVVIGTVAFVQQKPLNPGIGAFNIGDKAQIGFDRLELGANGTPPAPVTPEEKAVSDLFRAAGPILHAHNLLDGTATPDMAGAAAALGDAVALLETARTSIEAIPRVGKQRDPYQQAVDRLILMQIALGSAQAILTQGDPRKVAAVIRILECKLLLGLFLSFEFILPHVLAVSLPGEN